MKTFWECYKFGVTLFFIFLGALISGILTGFNNDKELEKILKSYLEE